MKNTTETIHKYSGLIKVEPEFSKEDVDILNAWQNKLSTLSSKEDEESQSIILNDIKLTNPQKWLLLNRCYNPLIKFQKNGIKIKGLTTKGSLRNSIESYFLIFIEKESFLKDLIGLNKIKEHTFNGIIKSSKQEYNGSINEWVYLIKDNRFYSINCELKTFKKANINKYPKEGKECIVDELYQRYFSKEIVEYVKLKNSIDKTNTTKATKIKL